MRVTLLTMRHSGTHTALSILQPHLKRIFQGEDWPDRPAVCHGHSDPGNRVPMTLKMRESDVVIMTMRHPVEVWKSWRKRGKRTANDFKESWRILFDAQQEFGGCWLPMDTPDRDDYLNIAAHALRAPLSTDWPRKGSWQGKEQWGRSEGDSEDEIRAFFRTLPFERFGYSI